MVYKMNRNSEVRNIPPNMLHELSRILDTQDSWKELMANVPHSSDPEKLKYTVDDIKTIEQAGKTLRRSCTEIFLDEWGTSGRIRPTLADLYQLLVDLELIRAADYISDKVDGLYVPRLEINTTMPHEEYSVLERITNNFCEQLITEPGGRRLGTGAFGSVFLGNYSSKECVAVKKLNTGVENVETQFINEIDSLSRFQHENLLPLLGYSCDGPAFCLIYEFMENGSLYDFLASKADKLPWQIRVNIALGTAKGIVYLHTKEHKKPLIHRDIKSANILLDKEMKAKLGDFGLVRPGSSGQHTQSIAVTSKPIGTTAYMAPEAFRGDISTKMDTFSFGVVLLELLTGLPPYDDTRQGIDLCTHVEAECEETILPLLDMRAGSWGHVEESAENTVADTLYTLATGCLEYSKKDRLDMKNVQEQLEDIMQRLV